MSDPYDDRPHLDPCGCCDGLSADTPAAIENPAGLPAIRYRAGTHAAFKSSMLARLVNAELEPDPLLGPVPNPAPPPDVRTGDDFSAALIDAFASAADVLTFYAERIANESYLRTATERRSVLELARTIGYELKPGVAAGAPVKLVIEEPVVSQTPADAASIPLPPPLREAPIPTGTKIQSVPGPNEKAQTFETIEDIVARPEWNHIKPRLVEPNVDPENKVWAEGKVDAKIGDIVAIQLFQNTATMILSAFVTGVSYDEETKRTRISFQRDNPPPLPKQGGGGLDVSDDLAFDPKPFEPLTLEQFLTGKYSLDDVKVQKSLARGRWEAADLRTVARLQEWAVDDMERTIRDRGSKDELAAGAAVYTFGLRAAVYGHNAPAFIALPIPNTNPVQYVAVATADTGLTLSAVNLDSVYSGIAKHSFAVLWSSTEDKAPKTAVYDVNDLKDTTAIHPAGNAKVTQLNLLSFGGAAPPFTVRTTTVLAQSTRFIAPYKPFKEIVEKKVILLDGAFARLVIGQTIAITGARADAPKTLVTEVRTLEAVDIVDAYTEVTLDEPLEYRYIARTVTISANVAGATHGETVEEILGDGDASVPYQSFTLKQAPLTYVADPTAPGGARSTLEIRVDELLWHEVPFFYGHGPRERIYVARRTDEGKTVVQFGDGIAGARVPTGLANVRAKYRKGIGVEGLVRAGAINLLLSRPLGLKGAANPLPSSGAGDPEPREEARTNAPLTVLTLDRVVSLRDYEDYARGYAGVAKSHATAMTGRDARGVFITVAGPDGRAITDTKAIEDALHTFGSPHVPLRVRTFVPLFFRIFGTARVDDDRDPAVVAAAVERALRDAFSFRGRAFGQPVHRSEVIALIQNVPGVLSVDVSQLETSKGTTGDRLLAKLPHGDLEKAKAGAELLLLDNRPLDLEVKR